MDGVKRPPQSLRATSARTRREGNGFGHAQVAQIQRARILAAMFDVASELGAANVSVAHVVERSGVSRRTFYETFSDREDCFVAAFQDALAFASQRVLPAYGAQDKWRDQIRAGLVALLAFLDEEPVIARLLIVESLTGGTKTLERRSEILAQVAAAVDEGRTLKGIPKGHAAGGQSASARDLPPLTAEGLVGGVLSLIHARLARREREASPTGGDAAKGTQRAHTRRAGSPSRLLDLTNQLMSMIVLPYLGPAAARRELDRPVEQSAGTLAGTPHDGGQAGERRDTRLLEDPFKDAGMRLTYRTVRVLLAVSEHSGGSNRAIGVTAGISDQGQISKLLGRLARLGLIENTGLGPGQGAPNAWTLTGTGRRVVHSVSASTKGAR
jgi:AcrR family transcriptional regulator